MDFDFHNVVGFRPNHLANPNSWVGHIPFAAWLVQVVNPSIFIELGTHTGNSYLSFCQTVKESNLRTCCYAIDTWKGDEHSGYYGEATFSSLNEYHNLHYKDFSRLLRMTFDEAVQYFEDESIELLHIDGLHTYEAVKHDFETWLPKLAPHAVVLFHDINVRERGFGVWKFWNEVKQKYPHNFEFFHSNGLGIIQLSENLEISNLNFFNMSSENERQFREIFVSLANNIYDQYKLFEHNERILLLEKAKENLKSESISFQTKFNEKEQLYQELQTKFNEKEQLYHELQTKFNEKEKLYQQLFNENLDNKKNFISQIDEFNLKILEKQNLQRNLKSKIIDLEAYISERESILQELNSKLIEIYGSTAWKLVIWMWKIRILFFPPGSQREKNGKKIFNFIKKIVNFRYFLNSQTKKNKLANQKFLSRIHYENNEEPNQINLLKTPECDYFKPTQKLDEFLSWQAINRENNLKKKVISELFNSLENNPLFSIIVPIYDPPKDVLKKTINSILNQSYKNFELILVDDCSNNSYIQQVIQEYELLDKRIKSITLKERGHISISTNSGIELAQGEFLVFVDHDDELDENALAQFVNYINFDPEADIIYSDDAKIDDTNAGLKDPKFKPDWSPELLLSYNYISHLKILRTSLVKSVGGFKIGFEGSQDHDLLLRASEKTNHIGHIPQILYFRRILPSSTASSGHAKPYSFEAGRKAVQEAFLRRGVNCQVEQPEWAFNAGLGVYTPIMPNDGPSVAIIIPTKNNKKSLEQLLNSIEKTTYKNFEVYIIDNESNDLQTIDYLSNIPYKVIRIENSGRNFNFSELNNQAVKLVSEDYILFLNDDTQVINSQWLSQMVGWIKLPGVGAVGARLLYPDGKLQHAGIALPYGKVITAFKGLDSKLNGYLMQGKVSRNCIAVTAAAMLTSREIFMDIGGFDQNIFKVAYNDVDYCLKLHQAGYRVVFCGEAELFHHESQSRGGIPNNPEEVFELKKKIRKFIDPFYNPNLSIDSTQYKVKPTIIAPKYFYRPVNVLVVSHNLNYEGAPQSAFEMISGLKNRQKIKPIVISPFDGPLRDHYEKENIEVKILGDNWISPQINDIFEYKEKITKFCKAVNLSKFDLVYANTATTFWAIDCATMLGIPSIWNIRESEFWQNYYDNYPKHVAIRALQSFAFPYRVIFVANSTRLRWKLLDVMNNFDVINNGLDYDRFMQQNSSPDRNKSRNLLGLAKDEICMISVGTICDRKGQKDLIYALANLPKNITKKLSLFIIGATDNEYTNSLIKLLEDFPIYQQEKVRIIKTTGDLAIYWNSADIFCFTSRIESYPRVILEAMSKSLPIITTPIFGISEQVIENENALFYNPGDTKNLANCISKLVNNPDLRLKFSKSSKLIFKTLNSYEEMLDKYEMVFTSAAFSNPSTIPYKENFSNIIDEDFEKFFLRSSNDIKHNKNININRNRVPIIGAFLPRLPNGIPDIPGFIRVIRPLRHKSLVDVLNLSLKEEYSEKYLGKIDALLVQRNAISSLELSEKLLEICHKNQISILYEIDDNLFNLPENHPSFIRYTPAILEAMRNIAENANALIVSTPSLKEYFEKFNKNIFILPNALDETLWVTNNQNLTQINQKNRINILYMGTLTHQQDFNLVIEAIKEIKNVYKDKVIFNVIGGVGYTKPDIFTHLKIPGWIQTYSNFVEWFTNLNQFNIGIAPLVDDNFNSYKSYIKYLDYGICGLVPVLSRVKAYEGIVKHEENGLLINNTKKAWYEAMNYLIENPMDILKIGKNAFDDVINSHTLQTQSDQRKLFWKEILNR